MSDSIKGVLIRLVVNGRTSIDALHQWTTEEFGSDPLFMKQVDEALHSMEAWNCTQGTISGDVCSSFVHTILSEWARKQKQAEKAAYIAKWAAKVDSLTTMIITSEGNCLGGNKEARKALEVLISSIQTAAGNL